MPSIKYSDLESAFDFVSAGEDYDAVGYVSRETGKVYCRSDWESGFGDEEEELPPDVDDPERYAEVPSKRDLRLGRRLVMWFVDEQMPDMHDEVASIFGRKGAYGRYKALLARKNRLEDWYRFEQAATRAALIKWAHGEDFTVEEDLPSPG